MIMPKLLIKGTICDVNLDDEIMLAHLLEDVYPGKQECLCTGV